MTFGLGLLLEGDEPELITRIRILRRRLAHAHGSRDNLRGELVEGRDRLHADCLTEGRNCLLDLLAGVLLGLRETDVCLAGEPDLDGVLRPRVDVFLCGLHRDDQVVTGALGVGCLRDFKDLEILHGSRQHREGGVHGRHVLFQNVVLE